MLVFVAVASSHAQHENDWKPLVDWGHWRLGHRSDPEFLEKNRFTITFGPGAPDFDAVSRPQFDQALRESKHSTMPTTTRYNLPYSEIPLAALFGKGYPNERTTLDVGSGRAGYVPLTIPDSRFLIAAKAKGEFTTFGPTMANVFADIPEGYTRGQIDPALREKLETVADQIIQQLEGKVTRLGKPHPYLELTTMWQRSGDRLLVHLVNYDVTLDGDVTSARDVDVQVILPKGRTIKNLMWSGALSRLSPVLFESTRVGERERITFNVNQVDAYGLAVVQLE